MALNLLRKTGSISLNQSFNRLNESITFNVLTSSKNEISYEIMNMCLNIVLKPKK